MEKPTICLKMKISSCCLFVVLTVCFSDEVLTNSVVAQFDASNSLALGCRKGAVKIEKKAVSEIGDILVKSFFDLEGLFQGPKCVAALKSNTSNLPSTAAGSCLDLNTLSREDCDKPTLRIKSGKLLKKLPKGISSGECSASSPKSSKKLRKRILKTQLSHSEKKLLKAAAECEELTRNQKVAIQKLKNKERKYLEKHGKNMSGKQALQLKSSKSFDKKYSKKILKTDKKIAKYSKKILKSDKKIAKHGKKSKKYQKVGKSGKSGKYYKKLGKHGKHDKHSKHGKHGKHDQYYKHDKYYKDGRHHKYYKDGEYYKHGKHGKYYKHGKHGEYYTDGMY